VNLKCVVFDQFLEPVDDKEVAIYVVISVVTLNNAHYTAFKLSYVEYKSLF